MKRWQPYLLLALANLFWAGNWVIGRALRESWSPVTLNFWRWTLATLILAPFALPLVRQKWPLLREHAKLLLVLALTGGALFQSLVYLGLKSTAAVNAVLINASAPLFILLCSLLLERERINARQLIGVLLSAAGIVVILGRGDLAVLRQLDFHSGDAWILLAMPVWGIYSVLLKRVPAELRGSVFLFTVAALTVPMLLGPMAIESQRVATTKPLDAAAIAGVGYVALFASVLAFTFWNRAVGMVGANIAGFSLALLPAFGTVLAIVFLGERLHAFHAIGFATILAGFVLASLATNPQRRAAPATSGSPATPPA